MTNLGSSTTIPLNDRSNETARVFLLLVNLSTGFAVLAHSLLGCGWHHGHEHAPKGEFRSVATHDVHDHDAHLDHDEAPAEDGEPCDEDRCTYVTSGKVRLPNVELAAPLFDVEPSHVSSTLSTRPNDWSSGPFAEHGSTTARLLTQVWRL